ASNFQGSVEDDAGRRTGARILPVLPQPADDVLNVDHGIIDHLADRDCESAQSHGVECYAERRQDNDGGKERKRDRRAADRRSAQVEQKKEKDDDNQNTAEKEGVGDIGGRCLYEIGGTKKIGMKRYTILLESPS